MLSVVKGGAGETPKSPDEWKAKLRELRRIEGIVRTARAKPKSGPRQSMVMIWSMLTLGGGLALGAFCTAVLQLKLGLWVMGVPCLAAIAVALYVHVTSKLPYSWAVQIDDQLARYEPIDQDAYLSLQKVTADTRGFMAGHLSYWHDHFFNWAATETEAINELAGFIKQSKFLEKKV